MKYRICFDWRREFLWEEDSYEILRVVAFEDETEPKNMIIDLYSEPFELPESYTLWGIDPSNNQLYEIDIAENEILDIQEAENFPDWLK